MAPDTALRAMTEDGSFRIVTARTTKTVRGTLGAQQPEGPAARHFADLVTGIVLVRLTMAPQLRVQGILRGRGRSGSLVADSHPNGSTRGLVTPGNDGPLDLGQGSILRVMRTLHDGRLHHGVVEVPDGGISNALMTYMQISEQVTTMVAVGTSFDGDGVVAAGGYLVQLLPGARRGPLMVMAERLREFENIEGRLRDPGFSPARLLEDLLYAMPYTTVGETDVRYECWCNSIGVISALSTLPREHVQSMIADGQVLEIRCDYCGREYRVAPAELRGLAETS